ncbi:MAG: proton-conducting transporter membrane subunit [bacterium]|nr:proton-conducting transporter membrane subunit [bacterium]
MLSPSGPVLLNIGDLLAVIAFLTMAIGNIVAIQQSSVKRMLAYSSISHAGYLLVAIVSGNDNGASSLMLYSLVYTITNLGAFTVAWLMNRSEGVYSFDDYNGLSSRHPALAGLMALFMISLAGIPPTGGFFGKYYIFYSALRTGNLWLAISMALFSAISVYYYLKIIVHMYMKPTTESSEPIQWGGTVGVGLAICAVVILATGLFPSSWVNLVGTGVKALGM